MIGLDMTATHAEFTTSCTRPRVSCLALACLTALQEDRLGRAFSVQVLELDLAMSMVPIQSEGFLDGRGQEDVCQPQAALVGTHGLQFVV